MRRAMRNLIRTFCFCSLFCMLYACSGMSDGTGQSNGSPTAAATPTPTATPTPIPPVYTDCPAEGTARAAVLPPSPKGDHPGVIYTTNDFQGAYSNVTSTLYRYDTVTGKSTLILKLTIPAELASNQTLSNAFENIQISNDGQWVAYQTAVNGKRAIQMVRADGQEQQTLYCFPIDRMFWQVISLSPGLKYLTFNDVPILLKAGTQANLVLLELATGKLHTVLPMPDEKSMIYEPIKWRDDNSLYVNQSRMGVGMTRNRFKISVLNNVLDDNSLQPITIPSIPNGSDDLCKDFDFSLDNSQILTSDCTRNPNAESLGDAVSGPSTIAITSQDGSTTPHIIYKNQTNLIEFARFINSTKIVFSTNHPYKSTDTDEDGLWEINTDGSGLTQLTTQPGYFELFAYSSSRNLSPDGTHFACFVQESGQPASIITESLDNTASKANLTEANLSALVGWTTL